MKVSVVVCTLKREKELKNCLNSLKKQSYPIHELIVVARDEIKIPGIKCIVQDGMGLPNARNCAIKKVSGDLVIFFDDDTIINNNYISNTVKIYKKHNNVGGITGKIKTTYDPIIKESIFGKIMFLYARIFGISGFFVTTEGIGKVLATGFTVSNFHKVNRDTKVECLSGCNMSYPKFVIDEIGLFDEKMIGNAYYEDAEYSYRVFKKGYDLYSIPNAIVDHLVTPVKRESLAKLKYYQIINNRRFFFRRVSEKKILRFLRFALCHLSLFPPILVYSFLFRDFRMIKSYIKAEVIF